MSDSIRLRGKLGEEVDKRRKKELEPIVEMLKMPTTKESVDAFKKMGEKKKLGGKVKVKKLLPGGLINPAMRLLVKSTMRKNMKKTPEIAAETFEDIKKARDIVQKSNVTFAGKKVDTSNLSNKDKVFEQISPLAAKIKKTELYENLSNLAIKSPKIKQEAKNEIIKNLKNLKEYKDQTVQKITSVIHKDVFKPTMQKSGGFIDMTKDKKYYKGML